MPAIGSASVDPMPQRAVDASDAKPAAPADCRITAFFERVLVWATRNNR